MKRFFPGDPEFSLANFWELPYAYIMNAVLFCDERYMQELHDAERPTATLTSVLSNVNRSSKRHAKPFTPEDYYWYQPNKEGKYPKARFGAAAKVMIEMELMPAWALFVYKDLKVLQDDAMPPEPLCLVHDNAIILGPVFGDRQVSGMLIAQHNASNQTLEMRTPDGGVYRVAMPRIDAAVMAEEDIDLNIFQ